MYADDTAIYCSSKSAVEISLTLQIELETVTQWFYANKLTLNTKKSKFLLFGNRQSLDRTQDVKLTINNIELERVTTFKYLGITLDECLTFDAHIDRVYKQSCGKLGSIGKVRKCLTKKLTLLLYKSLVLPYLDYGDTIYCCTSQDNLRKIQLVQNKACRLILMVHKRTHVEDMHN